MIQADIKLDITPLEGLKKALANRIMRRAISQASTPVKQEVKSNAQAFARTNGMAKSIASKIKTYPSGVVAIIGPKSDYSRTIGTVKRGPKTGQTILYKPSKIAHILDRGSKRTKPHPFLRAALIAQQSAFMQRLTDLIRQGIADELAKAASK